jgi:hypothetical protein
MNNAHEGFHSQLVVKREISALAECRWARSGGQNSDGTVYFSPACASNNKGDVTEVSATIIFWYDKS